MNSKLRKLMPLFCAGIMIYSGCAKKETVKADAAIAPSTTGTATTTPAQSAPSTVAGQQQPASASQTAAAASTVSAAAAPQSGSARQLVPVQAAASREEAKANLGTELEKIYFDFDSANLSDAARKTLADNFQKLKGNPGAKLKIEGHCDERGSDEYNLALSERRAQAAVQYLSSLGISADRLSAVGYGEEKPADPAQSEDAWSKNRRDEFNIIK